MRTRDVARGLNRIAGVSTRRSGGVYQIGVGGGYCGSFSFADSNKGRTAWLFSEFIGEREGEIVRRVAGYLKRKGYRGIDFREIKSELGRNIGGGGQLKQVAGRLKK